MITVTITIRHFLLNKYSLDEHKKLLKNLTDLKLLNGRIEIVFNISSVHKRTLYVHKGLPTVSL